MRTGGPGLLNYTTSQLEDERLIWLSAGGLPSIIGHWWEEGPGGQGEGAKKVSSGDIPVTLSERYIINYATSH